MDSNILEFEFLDLEKLNKEDRQKLISLIKPGLLVSGVELPWNLKFASNPSNRESPDNISKQNNNNTLKNINNNNDQSFPPTFPPPPTILATKMESLHIDHQISATAPAFVPNAATMANIVNLNQSPFTQTNFPPPFYARPPFPPITAPPQPYQGVTVGPPPGAPNLTPMDSPTGHHHHHYHHQQQQHHHNPHHHQEQLQHFSPKGGNKPPGDLLLNKSAKYSARRNKLGAKRGGYHDNNDITEMELSYDDNMCLVDDHHTMQHVLPPINHHNPPFHLQNNYAYSQPPPHPPQMIFAMPVIQHHYQPGFMGVEGPEIGHVLATGHYEGQPLTMSHSYHDIVVPPPTQPATMDYMEMSPRTMMYQAPPMVVGEIKKIVELPPPPLNHMVTAPLPIMQSNEECCTIDLEYEKCEAEERTKTPDCVMTTSLEDSGVDVGGGESPIQIPAHAVQALPPPPPAKVVVTAPPVVLAAPVLAPHPILATPAVEQQKWGGNKRWADLFKGADTNRLPMDEVKSNDKAEAQNGGLDDDFNSADDCGEFLAKKIGNFLQSYNLDFAPKSVQPRGLINRSNWCYINATLQALLACPPFYNLIKDLPVKSIQKGKTSTPVMNSLIQLIHEFTPMGPATASHKSNKKEELSIGPAFEPLCMHQMLVLIKSECIKGRQEDAEEFLSCILNGLHEEFLAMIKAATSSGENGVCNGETDQPNGHLDGSEEEEEDNESSDWQLMGPKNKGTVTHCSARHSRSPITSIFGGQIRSLLNAGSETSATLQPFFTLQLDIQTDGCDSVSDALTHLTAKENIHGYTCPKLKKEVEAFRRMTLEELPSVLIMHFKRFVYDDQEGGSKKVLKKTEYPMELELTKDVLSPEVLRKYSAKLQRTYRLFSVVYHDGKEAVKGHYIADVFHSGTGGWLRCDDRKISPTTEAQVLSYNSPCVPYLLFYGRNDSQSA